MSNSDKIEGEVTEQGGKLTDDESMEIGDDDSRPVDASRKEEEWGELPEESPLA